MCYNLFNVLNVFEALENSDFDYDSSSKYEPTRSDECADSSDTVIRE